MAKVPENKIEIVGHSVKGIRRILNLTRGQPGRIVVTVYRGDIPTTVVVTAAQLRDAIDRVDPR
jgi:hypothetical protein